MPVRILVVVASSLILNAQVARLFEQYRTGDADAAIAALCTLPLGPSYMQRSFGSPLFDALIRTEVGLRLNTFGRYALSAPLVPSTDFLGLSGMFEVNSLVAYRDVQNVMAGQPASAVGARLAGVAASEPALDSTAIGFVRDWYIVTVSYCASRRLDCSDALLAAARRDFQTDPDILLLAGLVTATEGRLAEAEVLFGRALAAQPTLIEARLRLGRVLASRGRLAPATEALTRAVREARESHQGFSDYFGLLSLAELDDRAGQPARAATRRGEARAVTPFDEAAQPWTAGLDRWAVYHAAQLWQIPQRIAAMRRIANIQR